MWSTVSSTYSYQPSECDSQSAAEQGTCSRDGRSDEARLLSEAMAASLEDARVSAAAPTGRDLGSPRGQEAFFSALGAPLEAFLSSLCKHALPPARGNASALDAASSRISFAPVDESYSPLPPTSVCTRTS